MSGGKLCFTNVGALFFRTNDEDVEFRHVCILCGLFKGTSKAYVLDAKELNGDIISNVDDVMIFLKKHLRISFKTEQLKRENILNYRRMHYARPLLMQLAIETTSSMAQESWLRSTMTVWI